MSGSALVKREIFSSEKKKNPPSLFTKSHICLINFSPCRLPADPFGDMQKTKHSIKAHHHELTHLKC